MRNWNEDNWRKRRFADSSSSSSISASHKTIRGNDDDDNDDVDDDKRLTDKDFHLKCLYVNRILDANVSNVAGQREFVLSRVVREVLSARGNGAQQH